MSIQQSRYQGGYARLEEYVIYKLIGPDTASFLQGQLTNDVKALEVGQGQYNARLTIKGRMVAHFILGRVSENEYIICTAKEKAEELINDLDRYLIMEDVEISKAEVRPMVVTGHLGFSVKDQADFEICWNATPSSFFINKEEVDSSWKELSESEVSELEMLSGTPIWNKNINENFLINETVLNEIGISYSKGCFLGQETVGKVESRRGAAFYPMLIDKEIKANFLDPIYSEEGTKIGKFLYTNNGISQVHLNRENQLDQVERTLVVNDEKYCGKLQKLSSLAWANWNELSDEIYHYASELFTHHNNVDDAISLLKAAIELNPSFADAYETLGVIYGRIEKYDQAIELMDKLLEVDESSVMAHTNLSYFYMRKGNIEKAEEEKANATVKSFSQFGKEAEAKRQKEEMEKQQLAEIERRESMFKQVLEMDPEDTLANYGLGDIHFSRNQFSECIEKMEVVLTHDDKYSVAYLLLGKAYEGVGDYPKAKQTYEKGIPIAAKKGDLMPANEMQSRLNKLN